MGHLRFHHLTQKPAILLINAGLLGLWLWLYRPVYAYLGVIFSREEFRTNQVVLLGAIVLIAMQVRKKNLSLHLDALPQGYVPALSMTLGGSAAYLLVERYLDINTFSATLFGLASYGLLGLWMDSFTWRRGLPAALLLVGALPFGEHLQTFVGYPVRILTASIVSDGLAKMGVQTVSLDTILIFENGISKVDLPCSGVKSLWTGGLFLLAATWIERRSINMRWMAAALGFAILLLAANLVRVAILVAVGQVAGYILLAEMLHVPLGVLGFMLACATLIFVFKRTPGTPDGGIMHAHAIPSRPLWLAPLLGGSFLLMAVLYTPFPQPALAQSDPAWHFPPEMGAEVWPLTQGEREWLAEDGIQSASRFRFRWQGSSGSLLMISSNTWRAHHRPERCFQVYGLSVTDSYTHLVAPAFPLRLISLEADALPQPLSAAYWLQSAEETTDDYATRIWADMEPERQRWVLVTVLFDEPVDLDSVKFQPLFQNLHASVQDGLTGGFKP